MPIIIATAYYPYKLRMEVGKKAIEAVSKFPPDESISKILGTAVMRDKHGIKIITMSEVMQGKLQEALERSNQTLDFYMEIDGFNCRLDIAATGPEAMQSINMKLPE
ncbi:MAG: hypothetical protein ACXABO_20635 [Promethearchaeota archaeon]|jgi:hypothetical protein